MRKRGGNIDNGKPGDAHGGHGSEECVDKTQGTCGRLGQTEERGTDSYEQKIGEHHQHDGVRLSSGFENVLGNGFREHLVL